MTDNLLIDNVLLSQFPRRNFIGGRQAKKQDVKQVKHTIMTIREQGLQLSGLITEMRNIIHNNSRFCFSDCTCDIQTLASMQEKVNNFIQCWAVQENGTIIADYIHEVKIWFQSSTYPGIYKQPSKMFFTHWKVFDILLIAAKTGTVKL